MKKWLLRILGGLLGLLLLLFVIGAALPLPADPYLAPEAWLAGASSVEPSYSGLQRDFPAPNEPADNPGSAAKEALGQALFFDPVLAANNDLSCADCHHPDYGFADGQQIARGSGATRCGAGAARRHPPGAPHPVAVECRFCLHAVLGRARGNPRSAVNHAADPCR